MDIKFVKSTIDTTGALIVFAYENMALSQSAKIVDDLTEGSLTAAARSAKFDGKFNSLVMMMAPKGIAASRILLVGAGEPLKLTELNINTLGASIIAKLQTSGETNLHVAVDSFHNCPLGESVIAARLAEGLYLRNYRFDKYRTKEPESKKPTVKTVTLATSIQADAEKYFETVKAVADGVLLTRDLISEPANILNPESFAKRIQELKADGVDVDVLGEKEMTKLGMGSLLCVGQGSDFESQLVVMRWNGAEDKKEQPIAFVGKGVTFDTGGISIKPAAGMEQMKWDMGGAGTVVGLMKALAGRKAKVNVVAVVGLVENMPSGTAQRPGDVVKSMSGQTIEVLNTDAEGRLVLADALWYCQEKFSPKFMVDLATLTGAIIITLGNEYAGIFSDSDELAERLYTAGKDVGDRVWRLPLDEDYDKKINSDIADMQNIGSPGAGSITAAQFLKRFTNNVPWCHMDVAGTVWSTKDLPLSEKGATGFGVRLLNKFVADYYEG